MSRPARITALATVAALLGVAVSVYLQLWGGVVLVLAAAAAVIWYRVQVTRGQSADPFFADAGEDTRLTSFQAGAPSEMPVDRLHPEQERH